MCDFGVRANSIYKETILTEKKSINYFFDQKKKFLLFLYFILPSSFDGTWGTHQNHGYVTNKVRDQC